MEELNFCKNEKIELLDLKGELEYELDELEVLTNKKEKRLRKYFKENDTLTKYQAIHNNLSSDLTNELKFLAEQKDQTGKSIVSIQKELSEVA